MRTNVSASVLIIGGGPVGLTAALDLAWRGIDVIVVEQRPAGELPQVKCNHVSSRSMEIFRRLGISEEIRNSGLPQDYPNDIAFLTQFSGYEIARIRIPSVCERRNGAKYSPDSLWPTPEPPHRINQLFLEPILFKRASSHSLIKILSMTALEDFREESTGIVAQVRELRSGDLSEIECQYMIGCDGSHSTVRRKLGIKLKGTAELLRNLSTRIRAPALKEMIKARPFWMAEIVNPRQAGIIVSIDGKDDWVLHARMPAGVTDFAAVDRDRAIRTALGVGDDFFYEIVSKEDWVARRLVAERMRLGRVFLAGDAAHLWIPNAGYGMNAGLADATCLTWMLAATLSGWASSDILDAYERERHPITEQVSHFVADFGVGLQKKRLALPSHLEECGAEGDRARAQLGRELHDVNVAQFHCAGLNFGYFYDNSPLVVYDEGKPPAYTMATFTASTVPGCRAPHVWLKGDLSLYDQLGANYSLLRKDPAIDCAAFMQDAASRSIPIRLLDVLDTDFDLAYERKLTLVRPDQHVAWRGDRSPGVDVLDTIIGASHGSKASEITGDDLLYRPHPL